MKGDSASGKARSAPPCVHGDSEGEADDKEKAEGGEPSAEPPRQPTTEMELGGFFTDELRGF